MFLFYVHEHIRQALQTNFISYFKNNTFKSVTFTVLLVHSYIFQQNNCVNMSEFKAQCRVFSLCSTSGWLSSWYLLHSLTVRLHAYDGFLTFAFLHKQISHFFHIRVGSGESVDMERQTVLLWIHSYFILSSASMIFHNTQVKSWAQEWGGSEISVWMSQRCSTASEKLPVPMSPC